jgi:hypothetical protein
VQRDNGESIPAPSNEYLASIRKLDTLLISLVYREPKPILQFSDLFTQGRLRNLQPTCRPRAKST